VIFVVDRDRVDSGRGRRIERELSGYFNYWWPCAIGSGMGIDIVLYLLSNGWK
jgi:hypothetical protein